MLRECRELTSEEILKELDSRDLLNDYMEARKALTELIKEGIIEKVPSPERMKFVFRLRN